jgi:hypothetical protein
VTGELTHTCYELEAHCPAVMDCRAYEASKQMPEILNLEAVPLSQLWPKKFKMEPPDDQDIRLWFISSHQRYICPSKCSFYLQGMPGTVLVK